MKNIKIIVSLMGFAVFFTGCTENGLVKNLGGSMTVQLEKDQKLVNCSWKSVDDASSLWILTRVRHEGEVPETYKYKEKSTFGILEGVVTIVEK